MMMSRQASGRESALVKPGGRRGKRSRLAEKLMKRDPASATCMDPRPPPPPACKQQGKYRWRVVSSVAESPIKRMLRAAVIDVFPAKALPFIS
jgi:hypothetical protein